MSKRPAFRSIASLVTDPRLLELRINVCLTVEVALLSAAEFLHKSDSIEQDENVRGLSMVLDMCADMASSTNRLYQDTHWYSGTALVRQIIEAEYLLSIFSLDITQASVWTNATAQELRKWWKPADMRKRLNGEFDEKEYWDHCERGGHPVPTAYPLLAHSRGSIDQRFCWVDFAVHMRRLFEALIRCFIAFGLKQHVEGDVYAIAWVAISDWRNDDPAPNAFQSIARSSH